jgi:hypothetical protein
MENAKTVEYKDDDGNWCYALVKSVESNGDLNLLYKAHSGGGWEVANGVPADSSRVF